MMASTDTEEIIDTAEYCDLVNVTIQVRCKKKDLFEIIINRGVVYSCQVNWENGIPVSTQVSSHSNDDKVCSTVTMVVPDGQPTEMVKVERLNDLHNIHDTEASETEQDLCSVIDIPVIPLPDPCTIEENYKNNKEKNNLKGFKLERSHNDTLGTHSSRANTEETEFVDEETQLSDSTIGTESGSHKEFTAIKNTDDIYNRNKRGKRNTEEDIGNIKSKCLKLNTESIRRKEKKQMRKLIKAGKKITEKRKKYSRAKSLLQQAVHKVGHNLKQDGKIGKDILAHAHLAVFFVKAKGENDEDEQCLLCGQFFYTTQHEEAEYHLFSNHLEEYKTIHKFIYTFDNYLEQHHKQQSKLSDDTQLNHQELDEEEDEEILTYNEQLRYITTPGGKKRLRKTKDHMLYTCLLCNDGNVSFSFQNVQHMKTAHPDLGSDIPESRINNYLVGIGLYNFIKEKKLSLNMDTGMYSCTTCDMKLDSRRSAIKHAKYGHSEQVGQFFCKLCQISFEKDNLLVQHMVDKHQSMRKTWFICVECLEKFETKTELRQHKAETHNDAFPCPFEGCSVKHYKTVKSFSLHCIKMHMSSMSFPADNDKGINKVKLKEDIVENEHETDSGVLNLVKQTDHEEEENEMSDKHNKTKLCSYCGETFTVNSINGGSVANAKYKLFKHMEFKHQEHIGDVDNVNVFECPVENCNLKFLSVATRNEHKRENHSDSTCPYEDCGKVFKKRATLNSHMRRTHAKMAVAQCQYCGKELCDKIQLQLHIDAVHEKKRDYVCHHSDCGKSFSRKSNLSVHLRIHTGEKPLKCEYCDFRGRQRNNITAHMRAHHADKLPAKK